MQILLVAATQIEIDRYQTKFKKKNVHSLITGVGMVATTFKVTEALCNNKYDIVINVGIAGSFFKKTQIGDVVEVKTEQFSELGVENDASFVSAFKMDLIDNNEPPFVSGKLINPLAGISNLPLVNAITVNKVHGNNNSIEMVKKYFSPDVESMEGGAVAYVCLQLNVKFVQIRAISNYVEKRNKEKWNISLAITNLNIELLKLIETIENQTS